MQAPCKDCLDRTVGCHSVCERYIEFRQYRDDIRDRRLQYLHDNREYMAVRWKRGQK